MPSRLDSPMMGTFSPTYGMAPVGAPQGNSLEEILASLSPEQLRQYLAGSTLDSQRGLAGQELANAQQVMAKPQMAMGHSTVGGAIGGGIGDIANALRGGFGQQQGMAGLQSALGNEQASNKMLAQMLAGGGQTPMGGLAPSQAEALSSADLLREALGGMFGGFGGF